MRPAGDVSKALLQAVRELATPERAPILKELTAHTGLPESVALQTLKDMKRYQEASDAILEAVRIQEDNFYYRNVLVSTLWLAGKEDEAVKQGYLCLALKDRIAVDKFQSSAYSDLSVKSRHPLFG